MASKVVMIDPPGGWKYGFPKEYDRDPEQESPENWFIRNGYPVADVELALKYSRMWEKNDED